MPDILLLGLIGFTGFLCQWLAWRVKLPAILFLLLSGIVLGPLVGLLKPDQLFGDLLLPLVSLSVAIILFEGSLTLKRSELKGIGHSVRNMVSYGALLNGLVTTLATHYLVGLSWSLSALFGAIMVVTGPTVIIPMLRSVRPNANIARVLRWEGIIIDPLGALFAVLVFEWIIAQQASTELSHVFAVFAKTIATGVILGTLGGYCFGLLLRYQLLPHYLHNFAAIAAATLTFALSNSLTHESGLLTVTIMGILLANMRGVYIRDILNFKENMTLMLVSMLFIILAARIDLNALLQLGWAAIGVLIVMQLVARPLKVFVSTIGSNFSRNERFLLAWIGPRGIVAAAVSAVFALKLEELEIPNAELLVPLAFSIIIGTVLIQSVTARRMAKWLNVSQPDTEGFLIMGANPVAVKIAQALQVAGIHSVLCDSNWDHICQARMAGLNTYYGSPISDHADVYLELTGLGGMLGLSSDPSKNTAAAMRFREDFGITHIFILAAREDIKNHNKHRTSEFYKGQILFSGDMHYIDLYRFINQHSMIKNTRISDSYTFEDWQGDNDSEHTLLLFAKDEKGHLHWPTKDSVFLPKNGWQLYALNNSRETRMSE